MVSGPAVYICDECVDLCAGIVADSRAAKSEPQPALPPTSEPQSPLREALASLEHARWGRWQAYLHSKCSRGDDGSLTIPAGLVERWERQIATDYALLSEAEKDSDRKEADKTLAAVGRFPAAPVGLSAEKLALFDRIYRKLKPDLDALVALGD